MYIVDRMEAGQVPVMKKKIVTTWWLVGCVWGLFFLYLLFFTLRIILHEGISELHGQNVGMLYVIIVHEVTPKAFYYFVVPSLLLIAIGSFISTFLHKKCEQGKALPPDGNA